MRCPDQIQRQINQEEVLTACNRVALVVSHVLEERNPRVGSLQKEEYRENSVSPPGRKENGRQNRICACSHRPLPSSGDVCRDPAFPSRPPQSIRAPPAEDRPGQLPGSPRVKAEVLPADQAEAPDLEHTLAWELHPTFLPAAF